MKPEDLDALLGDLAEAALDVGWLVTVVWAWLP
jgi:hypothetical protein